MLNLFTARECTNKEKFIYERIAQSEKEALVLVPNQYTLAAEEQALKYLGTDCLFRTEILSMNRLGHRILNEKGLESVRMISRYGRLMLLTRIIADHRDELKLFAKSAGRISFTQMLDDFIVAFKQQNCSIEELETMLNDEDSNVILREKIEELKGIIEDYEEDLDGKYSDSEDYIRMYVEAIPDCRIALGKDIWIYGYDSITPKFTQAMLELAKRADSVNFIVNENDYGLDRRLISTVRAAASEMGVEVSVSEVPAEFKAQKAETIKRIEQGLCKLVLSEEDIERNRGFVPEGLELVQCANQYYEAENAAAYIYRLIRDEGYELKDIAVICNSEDKLQPIVKRALQEYGLPVFMDSSRAITDSPGVVFIVNLLGAVRYRYNTDRLLAMLKTGMTGIPQEEIEDLENYAREFNIRGSMWADSFKYSKKNMPKEDLDRLNETRSKLVAPVTRLIELAETAADTGSFTDAFRQFLEDEYSLSERNEEKALKQEALGFIDDAQRTRISLEEAYKLLDQLKEIMPDYPLDIEEITDIYNAGLQSEEIGVIPPSLDGLAMGTLIRTRPRPARAVIILGANEGILPLQPSVDGLFSVDDKAYFKRIDFALGNLDDIKMAEENTALYRMLSHASERLYISFSMTDAAGKELVQSSLVDSIQQYFPELMIGRDVVSADWGMGLVNDKAETIRHLVNHIKDRNTEPEGDVLTKALLAWYTDKESLMLDRMLAAATNENEMPKLAVELTKGIYASADGNYKLSASKVQKFNDCPFSYYVAYGLAPREERNYSSDPRSIGDLYHECLQHVAEDVMSRKKKGEDIKDEELRELVNKQLSELAESYEGGLFLSTGAEEFHLDRIREICFAAAKAVAIQIQTGAIEDMLFETDFGRGGTFRPIEIEVGNEKVYIEGRIDRADIMEGGRVRIVDYKTGRDKVDIEKMKHGYKMQLMIYLMSTLQDEYRPAGIFYFNIRENEINMSNAAKVSKAEKKYADEGKPEDAFKLNGKYVDVEGMREMMPAEVLGGVKSQSISPAQFNELKDAVDMNITDIAGRIVNGDISISPLRTSSQNLACNYCQYRAICRYDSSYAGNRSREL